MKKKVVLLVAVAAVISLAAPRVGADDPARQLEGAWSVVAVTMNGVKSTERIANRFKVIVQGTKMTVKPGLSVNGDGKIEAGAEDGDEATFTLDPTKSPAQIDLTFGSGKNKMVVKGIYAVEKGELKICYSPKSRPADFANAADSGQTLLVGKRNTP
jgi:uncharacterized protein (TIGR03067 family)